MHSVCTECSVLSVLGYPEHVHYTRPPQTHLSSWKTQFSSRTGSKAYRQEVTWSRSHTDRGSWGRGGPTHSHQTGEVRGVGGVHPTPTRPFPEKKKFVVSRGEKPHPSNGGAGGWGVMPAVTNRSAGEAPRQARLAQHSCSACMSSTTSSLGGPKPWAYPGHSCPTVSLQDTQRSTWIQWRGPRGVACSTLSTQARGSQLRAALKSAERPPRPHSYAQAGLCGSYPHLRCH